MDLRGFPLASSVLVPGAKRRRHHLKNGGLPCAEQLVLEAQEEHPWPGDAGHLLRVELAMMKGGNVMPDSPPLEGCHNFHGMRRGIVPAPWSALAQAWAEQRFHRLGRVGEHGILRKL